MVQTLKNKMLTAPHHIWARHRELPRTLGGRVWPFHGKGPAAEGASSSPRDPWVTHPFPSQGPSVCWRETLLKPDLGMYPGLSLGDGVGLAWPGTLAGGGRRRGMERMRAEAVVTWAARMHSWDGGSKCLGAVGPGLRAPPAMQGPSVHRQRGRKASPGQPRPPDRRASAQRSHLLAG